MKPFILHASRCVRETTADLLRERGAAVTEVDCDDEAVAELVHSPAAVLVCQAVPPVAGWARRRRVVPLRGVSDDVARRLVSVGADIVLPADGTVDSLLDAAFGDETSCDTVPVLRLPEPEQPRTVLTPRQLDVVRLIARGLTSHEIADELGVRPKTVENYKQRVFVRLDVQNQAHAVARCSRLGLIGDKAVACLAS